MRKTTPVLTFVLLLVPVGAMAADVGVSPPINCNSAVAKLPPGVDRQALVQSCLAKAAERKARSASAITVAAVTDSLVPASTLDVSSAPHWSNADILSFFASIRDQRYLTDSVNPSPTPRRISWMYPDDGCYSRAEEFDKRAYLAQKTRPAKLFAFGGPWWDGKLRVYTSNHPSGVVGWWYHVVAAVRNDSNELIVFDPAIEPCRPLPWKDWLLTMQDNLAFFDDTAAHQGVVLADSNAYGPSDPVTGGPSLQNDPMSTNEQTGWILPSEWDRQANDMGRDVNAVLGASPPWSGYGCVSTVAPQKSTTLAANTAGSVTASCPFGTLAVGGGQFVADPATMTVSKNAKNGNGWQLTAKNTAASSADLTVQALCLVGAPTNAQVSSIQGNVVNINPGSYATSTASCSSGTLVGGGYTTTQGSTAVMRIYTNGRTSASSSTWQVSAQNTTATAKNLTAFAYCLPSTSFTFSQIEGTIAGEVGFEYCGPQNAIGGGYTFPRTASYRVSNMYRYGTMTYIVNMLGLPSGGDPNAKAYAECLAHP